jgi:fimbrial chaperone protein
MIFPARTLLTRATAGIAGFFLFGAQLWAGDFSVSPIRLDLGPNVRSGVITVKNEGKNKLSFQLKAMAWTQDAAGADQYADTGDLIFFPKLMTIEAGEETLVRVGARKPVVPVENAYRLFIEELPGPVEAVPEGKSARINVLLRFGAPVFVTPLKPVDSAEILDVGLAKGTVAVSIRNTGNRHQMVQGVQLKGTDAQGAEVYALTLADRYLLPGTTKSFSTVVEPSQCTRIAVLTVELKTDKLSLQRKLDVSRAMCS